MIEKPSIGIKLTCAFFAFFCAITVVFFLVVIDEIEAKIMFSVVFAGFSVSAFVIFYSLHKTILNINEDGIEQKRLFESIAIKWDEIAQCKMTGFGQVIINAKDGTVLRIRKSDYRNFNKIVERINEKSEVKYEWFETCDLVPFLIISIILLVGSLALFIFSWSKQMFLSWLIGIAGSVLLIVFMSWYAKRKLYYKSRWHRILFVFVSIAIGMTLFAIGYLINHKEPLDEWEVDFFPSFILGTLLGSTTFNFFINFYYQTKTKKILPF